MNCKLILLMSELHSSCIDELVALSDLNQDQVWDEIIKGQKDGLLEFDYNYHGIVISSTPKIYEMKREA